MPNVENAEIGKCLDAIDRHDDELATLLGQYRNSCKGPRSEIREIIDALRESGEDMKAFRVTLKGHREQRRHQKRIDALEPDSFEAYQRMAEQLGDFGTFGLGAAALDRAKPQSGDDALDNLRA